MGYVFQDRFFGQVLWGTFFGIAFLVRFCEVRFSGLLLGAKIRGVCFSGSLFWSGFVRYVLRGCVLE